MAMDHSPEALAVDEVSDADTSGVPSSAPVHQGAHSDSVLLTGVDSFDQHTGLVMEWMASFGLTAAACALRTEIVAKVVNTTSDVTTRHQFVSQLEHMLDVVVPTLSQPEVEGGEWAVVEEEGTMEEEEVLSEEALTEVAVDDDNGQDGIVHWAIPGQVRNLTEDTPLALFQHLSTDNASATILREQHGQGTPRDNAVFHPPEELPAAQATALVSTNLRVVYNPHLGGLQDERDPTMQANAVIAGRCGESSPSSLLSSSPLAQSILSPTFPTPRGQVPSDQGVGQRLLLQRLHGRRPPLP
jgi:hypothetical protein